MNVDTICLEYELSSNSRALTDIESDIYDILDFYDICIFELSVGYPEQYDDPDTVYVCDVDYVDLYRRYDAEDIFNAIASCFAAYNISISKHSYAYVIYPDDFIEAVADSYAISEEEARTALVEADYL